MHASKHNGWLLSGEGKPHIHAGIKHVMHGFQTADPAPRLVIRMYGTVNARLPVYIIPYGPSLRKIAPESRKKTLI